MNYRNENIYNINNNNYSDNNGEYVDLDSHFSKRAHWMGKLAFKNYGKQEYTAKSKIFWSISNIKISITK